MKTIIIEQEEQHLGDVTRNTFPDLDYIKCSWLEYSERNMTRIAAQDRVYATRLSFSALYFRRRTCIPVVVGFVEKTHPTPR